MIKKFLLCLSLVTSIPLIAMEGNYADSPLVHEFAYRLQKLYESLETIVIECKNNSSAAQKDRFIKTLEKLEAEIKQSEIARKNAGGGKWRGKCEDHLNNPFSYVTDIVKDLMDNSEKIFSNNPSKETITPSVGGYYWSKFFSGDDQPYKIDQFLDYLIKDIKSILKSGTFTMVTAQKCSDELKKEIDALHAAILNENKPNQKQTTDNTKTQQPDPIINQQAPNINPQNNTTTIQPPASTAQPIAPTQVATQTTDPSGKTTDAGTASTTSTQSTALQPSQPTNTTPTTPSKKTNQSLTSKFLSPWQEKLVIATGIALTIAIPATIYALYQKNKAKNRTEQNNQMNDEIEAD